MHSSPAGPVTSGHTTATRRRSSRAAPAFLAAFALLAALGLALAPSAPARADDDDKPRRTVSVSGHGEVKARPDMATVNAGVVSEAPTARAALDANTAAMTRIVAALKADGIAAKDIRTETFNVSPVYTQPKERNERPRIDGYRVSNSLSLAIRDLEKVGATLDRLVSLGANTGGNIRFGFADPATLETQARKAAMADAHSRAELYAEAAGARLGKVLTISEGGHAPPRPYARALAAEAAPVPVEAGEQAVTASVSVTWELE